MALLVAVNLNITGVLENPGRGVAAPSLSSPVLIKSKRKKGYSSHLIYMENE